MKSPDFKSLVHAEGHVLRRMVLWLSVSAVLSGAMTPGTAYAQPYTLTVTTQGQGSVELSDPCGPYDEWTDVGMAAVSDYGWQFDHWEGDYTGSDNPGWIWMDGNKSVTAVFTTLTADYLARGRYYMFREIGMSGLRHAYQAFQAGIDDPGYTNSRELVFLHALARGIILVIDNDDVPVDSLLELAEQFGVTFAGDYFIDVNAPLDLGGCYQLPGGAPDLQDIYDFTSGTTIPEIDAIYNELDSITDSPGDRFRIYLTPAETGLAENLEVDYGDLSVLKTLLLALRAYLQGQIAYDLYIDPAGSLAGYLLCGQVPEPFSINDYVLDPHPDLLKVLPTSLSGDGAAALAQAKQDWIDAITAYLAAYNYIVNEDNPPGTDPQDDELLYLDPNDQPFVENWCNSRLETLRDSVQNDEVVSFPAETTVTYDLFYDGNAVAMGDATLVYDISAIHGEVAGTEYGSPDWEFEGEFWRHGRGIDITLWSADPCHFGYYEDIRGTFSADDSVLYLTDAGVHGDRSSTQVVDVNVDLNPLYGSTRYPSPVDLRDLLPSFDDENLPIRDTFGHGLGDDATLGGAFPDMTQDDWWQFFTDLSELRGWRDGLPDFSGDGKSDLLWRQVSTGYQTATLMDGLTMGSSGWLGGNTDWPITRTPDFDGDGKSDLLWRQASTGYHTATLMDGLTMGGSAWLGGNTDWQIVGTPDFNGDGKSDLLWRQASTGYQTATLMNGLTVGSSAWLGGNTDWQIVGTPDFNGDGKSDLLWRQVSTGYHTATLMNGLTMGSSAWLGGNTDWEIVRTPDFDGDGESDLLWRQVSTGYQTATLMDGLTVGSSSWLGGNTDWPIVATPDLNGDGKSDLLWRQVSTGNHTATLMDGLTMGSNGWLGGNTDWPIVGTPDFNGDGKSDILWRQVSTGYHTATLMDGLTTGSSAWLGGNTDWQIVVSLD